jgi:hypothetical protein
MCIVKKMCFIKKIIHRKSVKVGFVLEQSGNELCLFIKKREIWPVYKGKRPKTDTDMIHVFGL